MKTNVGTEKTRKNERIVKTKVVKAETASPENEVQGAESGRDYTRYSFKNTVLGKRQLVLSVIHDYMEQHPETTSEELEKIFGHKVVKPVGKIRRISSIVKKLGGEKSIHSYFLKEEQLVKASDGTYLAVFNRWAKDSINSFLDSAKEVGYKIKPATNRQLAHA